jgi:hypothetical protein
MSRVKLSLTSVTIDLCGYGCFVTVLYYVHIERVFDDYQSYHSLGRVFYYE